MKKLFLLSLLFTANITFALDCKSYVARLKHTDGTYQDYDKIDKAILSSVATDKIYVGKDTQEDLLINGVNNLELIGECSNNIRSIKIQKSKNVTVKNLKVTVGKNSKPCVHIAGNNQVVFNESITLSNINVKNCASNGINIDPFNRFIKIENSKIENNAGYGIYKVVEPNGIRPEHIELLNNIIINNNGAIIPNVSSKDLGNIIEILDNTDSGNQTTANNEGPGVGNSSTSDLVAITNNDQTLSVGNKAILDGSRSKTLFNRPLTYSWNFLSRPIGSNATIANSNSAITDFNVDIDGDYVVELTVNDGIRSVKDQLRISTINSRPIAIISNHPKIVIGEEVILSGNESFDPDGSALNYQWTLIKAPTGSQVQIVPNGNELNFIPDLSGDYIFELQVNDGELLSKKVRKTFSTVNNLPVIQLVDELEGYRSTIFQLSAQGTNDPDGNTLTYNWALVSTVSGATTSLSNPNGSTTNFSANKNGFYVLNLLVSDGTLKEAKTITIFVNNRSPIASISTASLKVEKGSLVNLSASASDPDGDATTLQWSIVSRPVGSNATITNAQSLSASFVPDVGGTYVVKFQVTDIYGALDYKEVTIKASTRPIARLTSSGITGFIGDKINFDGSTSSDEDGDSLIYIWTLTNSPAGSVSDVAPNLDNTKLASLLLSKAGSYSVSLVVSDGVLDSTPVTINLSSSEKINLPPTVGSIGNFEIEVAHNLKFTITANDSENDKIMFFLSGKTPLKTNMKFLGDKGEFSFVPSPDQVGTHHLVFVVSDGKNNIERPVDILVKALSPDIPTSYRGRVYDANSTTEGHDIPIVGAKVSLLNSNVHAYTDANGYFVLENIKLESDNFKIDCATANKAPDGSTYANFIELISIIPHSRNEIDRPFYLPRIDKNATVQVEPNKPTVITNVQYGMELTIPANGALNPDGTPYTGQISASIVPRALAPVALPEEFAPGMLITVQPSGVKFSEPVPISYPNIDKLPPGTLTNIYQIDDKTGMFGVFGQGRVTDDGKRIETISGGLVNGSWGFVPPPLSFDLILDYLFPEDCNRETSECASSRIDRRTGSLFDDVKITPYKSGGANRSINLIYSSSAAKPVVVFDPIIPLGNANSIPDYVSAQLFVEGAQASEEIFMDIKSIPKAVGEKLQHKIFFNASHLETGIYKHDILLSAHFPSSTTRFRTSQNPNYTGNFGVVNLMNSSIGSGWAIDSMKSLHFNEHGQVGLLENGGRLILFKPKATGGYEIPRNRYYFLEKINNSGYRITDKVGTRFNFNLSGQLISEVDANNNETTYHYEVGTNKLTSIEDPFGKKYKFVYNTANLVEKIIDPALKETKLYYDTNNNLVKIVHPDLSSREMNYNEEHLLIAKRDAPPTGYKNKVKARGIKFLASGVREKRVVNYDYAKTCDSTPIVKSINVTTESTRNYKTKNSISMPGCQAYTKENPKPLYQPSQDAIEIQDKNGNITKYDLDDAGFVVRKFDPLNRLTQTLRDDHGNVVFEQDPENRIKQTLYDLKNNPTQISIGSGAEQVKVKITYDDQFSKPLIVEEVGKGKSTFKIDTKGNIIASKDAQNVKNFYKYNNRGQLMTAIDANNNQTQLSYGIDGNLKTITDPEGNKSQFFYDPAGNLTKIIDPKLKETIFEYDLMNRLKKTINANNEETKFEYDFVGNLISLTDSRNQTTFFEYDANDRLVKRTDPLGKVESYAYDAEGNLLEHTDRKNQVFSYEYNVANELVKKVLPDNSEVLMTYDLAGNLKTISDQFSRLSYTYDQLNRVKTVSTNGSPYQPGITLTNSYDKSNRTKLLTPMGEINYTYDLQNRLTNLQTLSGSNVGYFYDNQGRRSKVQFPNGITTNLTFDESSRLTKIAHEKNGSNLLSYSYQHDNNGNRTQMNVTSPIAEALSQVNYTYDNVNQLMSATKSVQSNSNESFTYDNLGNRLKKNNQVTNNVYDNNNRIVSDDVYNYTHDDNGNLIKKVKRSTGYTTRYIWDFENKLQFIKEYTTETDTTPVKTHTFLYDVYGRRIVKDSDGVVHKYVYDNEDILFEFDNNDSLVSSFSHGPGIDEPVEIIQNNQNYYYHVDGLGSITGISNTNGEIVQSYAYSSFGETKVYDQAGALIDPALMQIKSPYGFTSREFDFETGKYQYRARDYIPALGRFLTADPIHFKGGDTNLYRYVNNKTISNSDPFGKYVIRYTVITDNNYPHSVLGVFTEDDSYYIDFGPENQFSLLGITEGKVNVVNKLDERDKIISATFYNSTPEQDLKIINKAFLQSQSIYPYSPINISGGQNCFKYTEKLCGKICK